MIYASLDYTKSMMKAGPESNTIQDDRVLQLLRTVSRRIDNELDPTRRRQAFAPVIETRTLRVSPQDVNSHDGTLRIPGSLLAFTSAALGGTALSAVEAWPPNLTPIEYLRLTGCCEGWYSDPNCGDGPLLVTIAGTWGIHRDWANAWLQVDTLAAAITDTTTITFTVGDADAEDPYGVAPRISVGDLLRIDTEYMEVGAVDTGTNTITVRRGVHGSTAATHLISAPVYRFEVEEPIKYVTARQAGLMYARLGAYTTVEVSAMGGEVRYPADLLQELRGTLQGYVYGH